MKKKMIHHTVHICETFLLSHFLLVWNIYEYLVPDLWYFYTDLDPTLFVTGFHETKEKNFFLLIATVSSFTSVFKDIKSLQSHKRVEIRFFLFVDERMWNRTKNYWSGRPRNWCTLQTRLRNTVNTRNTVSSVNDLD